MAQVAAEEGLEEVVVVRRLSNLMEAAVVTDSQVEAEARPFLVVEEVQRQKLGRS